MEEEKKVQVNKPINHKLLLVCAFFLGAALVIFFVSFVTSKRLILKQKAFGGAEISLIPASGSFTVNDEFTAQIVVSNPSHHEIAAVSANLNFDPAKLEIVKFEIGSALPDISMNDSGNDDGNATFEVVKMEGENPTSETITVGTIFLKGKQEGSASLNFNQTNTIIGGYNPENPSDRNIAITAFNNGTYTINAEVTNTPTPTETQVPVASPTPTETLTPQATVTPTPTQTPIPEDTGTPTPTATIPPNIPVLNFKVKFQGVDQKRADQKVKVTVIGNDINSPFEEVTVKADDDGFYNGSFALNQVPEGNYTIFIKGPKHLAKKFCKDGQEGRCGVSDRLSLVIGNNDYDFSKVRLEGGDLPNPNNAMKQDGVVNSVDYELAKLRLGSSSEENLRVADINLDGIVNTTDLTLLRNTLETKYEEDY